MWVSDLANVPVVIHWKPCNICNGNGWLRAEAMDSRADTAGMRPCWNPDCRQGQVEVREYWISPK